MHIRQRLYILIIFVCYLTGLHLDYLDELILFNENDHMFFTHASKSGNLLSKYNRQCQLVTLKVVYLQFYDSISANYIPEIRDRNKARVRNNYNYRMKVMNS